MRSADPEFMALRCPVHPRSTRPRPHGPALPIRICDARTTTPGACSIPGNTWYLCRQKGRGVPVPPREPAPANHEEWRKIGAMRERLAKSWFAAAPSPPIEHC